MKPYAKVIVLGRVERCQVMWLDSSVGRAED